MRSPFSTPSLVLLTLSLSACVAGPHQLRRSADDWDHHLYVTSPWLDVGMNVVPVIPMTKLLGAAVDFLVVDPIAFWGGDAWDNKGTGFRHTTEAPDRWYGCVFEERSSWLRLERHDLRASAAK